MKISLTKIGKGRPEIAVVGCLHGDEIIGKKVIAELKKVTLQNGSLKLIIANEKALVRQDLNRSFPGKKKGNHEERLAYLIHKEIRNSDIVLDIHATTANFDRVVLVTNLRSPIRNILRLIPCKNIVLLENKIFGKGAMIRFAKTGIAIEYGPDKKGGNYKKALQEILTILKNLNLLSGAKKNYPKKELYTVEGSCEIASNFKINKNIKNFKLIKKGDLLGKISGKKEISKQNFYPLFVGEKSYQGILAIMANKSILTLT
jgi:succinylglutamate desuccinylase